MSKSLLAMVAMVALLVCLVVPAPADAHFYHARNVNVNVGGYRTGFVGTSYSASFYNPVSFVQLAPVTVSYLPPVQLSYVPAPVALSYVPPVANLLPEPLPTAPAPCATSVGVTGSCGASTGLYGASFSTGGFYGGVGVPFTVRVRTGMGGY
jgi:hypothetical protein